MHPVVLTVDLYQGVVDLMSKLKIGKSAAILLALNEGLHKYGVTSDEVYEVFDRRYRRPLKEAIAERQGKRDSHTHVLTLEKMKEAEQLKAKDANFKNVLKDWNLDHPRKPNWRANWIVEAQKYPQLPHAQKILELASKETT